MKKGWKNKTLEQTCQFSNGLWKGEKPPFVNVGVIRNTNFTKEGTLDDSNIAYLDVEAKKLEKRRLQFGDIILEKSGGGPKQPVGRVALFDKQEGDFSFSNFTAALRVLDPNELDFRFAHKFLHWTYVSGVTEGMQSNSTGIRNLDGDAYKGIEISFPPLAEQQRIVKVLDEAFAGLATAQAHAEKNLQNAREIFESHLQSVFTQRGPDWVETTIGQLLEKNGGEIKTGPFGTKLKASEYTEAGVPVISVGEVRLGKIVLHDRTPRVDKGVTDRMPEYVLEEGDIVFGRKGGVERSACVRKDQAGWFLGSDGIRLRLPTDCNRRFLAYQFLSPTHKNWMLNQALGTTMPSLNQKIIERIPIAICSLPQQQSIVEQLDSLTEETQRLAQIYERKRAALDELKKSLLHQAFHGDL